LKKNEFATSTIFNDRASNVINTDGIVKINKVELGGTSSRGTDPLLANISHVEGIAANNGIYAIVYHADTKLYQEGTTSGFYYEGSTQLFSFVNFGGGFVLHPSFYYVNISNVAPDYYSKIYFNGNQNNPTGLSFPSYYLGYTSYSSSCINIGNKDNYIITVTSGKILGTYATLLGGQFAFLSGSASF
jgi:hypothetical protein